MVSARESVWRSPRTSPWEKRRDQEETEKHGSTSLQKLRKWFKRKGQPH